MTRLNNLLNLIAILLIAVALPSCDEGGAPAGGVGGATGGGSWGGPGSGTGGGGGGGGGGGTLTFDGPTDASPASTTSVAVTWNAAATTAATGSNVVYDVFRADNVDMIGEILIGTTAPGVTSLVDDGLAPGTTSFYRVVARNEDGQTSEPETIVSSHLPTQPTGTPLDYATDVEPLWSRLGSDGVTTCLTCHDGTNAQLDLRSWDGLMTGIGTPAAPDTFVTPGLGEDSWRELIRRILSHNTVLPDHRKWQTQVADYEAALVPWINEGATQAADTEIPEFDEADLANSDLHRAEDVNGDRVGLLFPHAMDPESVPFGPRNFDHLRYIVYAGETSNTIDWDKPARKVQRDTFPLGDDAFQLVFDWLPDTGVFVVRAVDFFGNESINEVEVELDRTGGTEE